jgi:hypothetical protein
MLQRRAQLIDLSVELVIQLPVLPNGLTVLHLTAELLLAFFYQLVLDLCMLFAHLL